MRDIISDIIEKNPKHYTVIIKRNPVLLNWVNENSLIKSDKFIEMIYSAIHGESNLCSYGNRMKISRFSEGWVRCGTASTCQCTKENISKSVSKSKSCISDDDKTLSNNKRKITLLKKYGYEYNSQRPEIKDLLSKPKIDENTHLLLSDRGWLETEYVTKQRSLVDIAQELNIYYGTVGEHLRKHGFTIRQRTNYSLEEKLICDFLDSINIAYERNNWDVLGNAELDIYIPSHRLGIEVNGLYWHSYNPYSKHTPSVENRTRHLKKTNAGKEIGVDIIQLTDFEINNKIELVKSLIRSKLGLSARLYARKCIIQDVTKAEEKLFLNKNHFQGYCHSLKAKGLYYENELVMIMTFGKPRYSKTTDVELIRLCTKMGTLIVGGASRLFQSYIVESPCNAIVSYSDLSKFTGTVYNSLGFKPLKLSEPGYIWTDGNLPISRYKCQHKSLSVWLKTYNKDLSESENLFLAGFRRYWDCGQQTWIKTFD